MTGMAVVWGVVLGVGLSLVWAWVTARRPSLDARLAPYVRGPVAHEVHRGDAALTPFPTLERIFGPLMRDGVMVIERWGSSASVVTARLLRAGSPLTVEQYRVEQVVWAGGAMAAGTGVAVLLAATRGAAPVSLVVLVACMTVAGAVARDALLTRAIARREARIMEELPTVAELLALAVGAGESVTGALERLTRLAHGAVVEELTMVVTATHAGMPLTRALQAMADRTGVGALRRFAESIATAVERGTPLAEVLRAQAHDVRAEGKRALMEEGGKREIAMLVPVVFLILPVTVVFAVYPGLVAIRWGM